MIPNCPRCKGQVFFGSHTTVMGVACLLVYCGNCGAVVGAFPKP
jgi:ribosomal protein S27AE